MEDWVFQIAQLAVIFALTFLVETLTEYLVGILFDKYEKLSPFKWMLQYLAAAFGVGLAFYYKIDLIEMIAAFIKQTEPGSTNVGLLLTGLIIGRGSNYLHQFISQYFPKPKIVG